MFLNEQTLEGSKLKVYAMLKILKYLTKAPVTSYKVKFALAEVLSNRQLSEDGIGSAIQDVINHPSLRGKFNGVRTELIKEGICTVEVTHEGLHFVKGTTQN